MDFIIIKGYKSIKDARIDFLPINILIGANGSGKSNFLSFFEFFNKLTTEGFSDYVSLRGGADKILHKGSNVTDAIYLKTEFDNGNNGYLATLKLGTDGFVVTSERLIYKGDKGVDISRSDTKSRLSKTDNYRAKYVIKYLKTFRKYHFHDTGAKSPFSQLSHIQNDSYFLYEKGENLAAFLFNIKTEEPKHYNRIVDTVRSIAPFFNDFYLQPNKEGYVRLQWQDKYSSIIYGVNDLSDGTIRFIALTTLFLQPELPKTILIDEPELGLHPFAIAKLAGLIQSAAAKDCQVIAATQSTDFISHFNPEDIITVDQKNGETEFKRLEPEKLESWLDDYTIDDLWKRNIISSGQPNY